MRKLAWTTVGFTYLLMVWGNMVSATGSGLACPDWPTCHGTVLPPLSFPVILEWGHRLLAATTSILIIATVVTVLRSREASHSTIKRAGRSMLFMLVCQILLGGLTVMLGLSIVASTVHLVIASLVFGGLLTLACVVSWGDPEASGVSSKIRRLSLVALGAMLVQLVLGAVVRHGHAGLACPNFPLCLDGILPPGGFETLVAFAHRWWGIAMIGLLVHMAAEAARTSPALKTATRQAFMISIMQVLLGIGTVLTGLHTHTRGTHAAIGYLLWGVLAYITIRTGAVRFLWDRKNVKVASLQSNLANLAEPAR